MSRYKRWTIEWWSYNIVYYGVQAIAYGAVAAFLVLVLS